MAGLRVYRQTNPRRIVQISRFVLAGFALFGLSLHPSRAHAQDSRASVIDLASLTLVPLPNQSIAGIKGSGFSAPNGGNSASSGGAIILWDELKMPTQPQNSINGTTVITINGSVK